MGADRLGDACEVLDWMADDGVAGNAVVYQTLINAFLERDRQDKVRRRLACRLGGGMGGQWEGGWMVAGRAAELELVHIRVPCAPARVRGAAAAFSRL